MPYLEEIEVPGDQREIGRAVRGAREALGMSMTVLARKVGISQAQISRLEDGQQGFRTKTMQKIAEALNVPMILYFGPKSRVDKLIGR